MDTQIISSIILGFFASGIAIYFSRKSKRMEEHRFMKELFRDFNSRYNDLNNSLIKIKSLDPEIKVIDLKKDVELYNDLNDYFNLCAEEYFWYKEKRISEKIWKSWKAGLDHWYENVPVIRKAWEEETEGKGKLSFYLELNEVDFFNIK